MHETGVHLCTGKLRSRVNPKNMKCRLYYYFIILNIMTVKFFHRMVNLNLVSTFQILLHPNNNNYYFWGLVMF